MLGICKNGHMTGQRHCGLCGEDRVRFAPGAGKVEVAAYLQPRQVDGPRGPVEPPLRILRRETRVSGGPLAPNQNNNGAPASRIFPLLGGTAKPS